MVQVFSAPPSFGDKLRESLVGATGNVLEGIQRRRAQTELQKLFEAPQQHPQAQVQPGEAGPNQAPSMSPIEQIFNQPNGPSVGQIMNIRNKLERLSPGSGDTLINYHLQQQKNQQAQELAQQKAATQNEAAERAERHHRENLEFKEGQEAEKKEKPIREKRESSEALLSNVKKMESLIPYTGTTYVPGTKSFLTAGALPLNREGIQKRNQFDVLAASAASFFRDLETKGQLPIGLFNEVIKPRLPNSKLSERENQGRLDGIRELAETYGGLTKKEDAKLEATAVKLKAPNGQIVELSPEQAEEAIKRNTGWKKE